MANVISNGFTIYINKASGIPVTGVSLDKTSVDLRIGDTSQLSATISPSNATNKNVSYSSSNTGIATVSSTGLIEAKANGTCTISVITQDGGKTATCSVNVTTSSISVTSVFLDKTNISLEVNGTTQLEHTISPPNATNQNVTYSSNNTSIATVSSGGLVTAKARGNCVITVTTSDGNKTATCSVSVVAAIIPVTSVSLNKTSHTFTTLGDSVQLSATVLPSNADNKGINWTTSDLGVATVINGLVRCVKNGSCVISAVSQDKNTIKATCSITVNASGEVNPIPPAGVKSKLYIAKSEFDTAHTNLKNIINSTTDDNNITPEEQAKINNAFSDYNTALAKYSKVSQEAVEAIAERKKQDLGALTDKRLSEIKITTDSITSTVSDLGGKYTEIKQTIDSIDLTGVVTFSDLSTSNGKTIINGSNIKTGTLTGDLIKGGIISGSELRTNAMTAYGGVWIQQNGIQIGGTSLRFGDGKFRIETSSNTAYASTGDITLMPGMSGGSPSGSGRVVVSGRLFVGGTEITGGGGGGTAVFG